MQQPILINYITEAIIALQLGHLHVARKKLLRALRGDIAPFTRADTDWIADRLLKENMPKGTIDELTSALNRLHGLYQDKQGDFTVLLEFLEHRYFNSCMYQHAERVNKQLTAIDASPNKKHLQTLASTCSALGREEEALSLLRFAQCLSVQ